MEYMFYITRLGPNPMNFLHRLRDIKREQTQFVQADSYSTTTYKNTKIQNHVNFTYYAESTDICALFQFQNDYHHNH